MAKTYSSLGALSELILAAALWGFGFIATIWVLQRINAFEITFLRFAMAGVVGIPFLLTRQARKVAKEHFMLSGIPALLLVATLVLQTWGLQFTSPTKSGFITTLYVVFVPLLEALLSRQRLPRGIWLCVTVALLGTALIVDIGFSELNFGDVLTFLCAFCATAQIYWLGGVSPRISNPFVFNIYQCFWATAMALPMINVFALRDKLANWAAWTPENIIGMISLAFGSSLLAFYLQVRGQARLSRTVSSLLFLLESPFALLFALLFLGQSLSGHEALGAVLIFSAAFFATWLEARAKKIAFVPELLNS